MVGGSGIEGRLDICRIVCQQRVPSVVGLVYAQRANWYSPACISAFLLSG